MDSIEERYERRDAAKRLYSDGPGRCSTSPISSLAGNGAGAGVRDLSPVAVQMQESKCAMDGLEQLIQDLYDRLSRGGVLSTMDFDERVNHLGLKSEAYPSTSLALSVITRETAALGQRI
jgi:hypothetical protein